MAAWSVTGAIAAQGTAHERLMKAIENGTAVHIFMGDCQITTCASVGIAKMWIGKAVKKYRIVPMGAKQ